MIVISWYTENTEYYQVAHEKIIPSLTNLNLDHRIYTVQSKWDWKANTNLKPSVIEQAFEELNTDLLVVDADAIIYDYPSLLYCIPEEYDCAMFWLDWDMWYKNNTGIKELCSGTLWFRNRLICKKLISKWKEYCSTNEKTDQQNLALALKQIIDINVYLLPIEYCWIHDLPGGREPFVKRPEKVIVEHFQASRQLKRRIK